MKSYQKFAPASMLLIAVYITLASQPVFSNPELKALTFFRSPYVESDSSAVLVDGKYYSPKFLKEKYNQGEIAKSMVVFGPEIRKQFGYKSLSILVTAPKRNDQAVNAFVQRVTDVANSPANKVTFTSSPKSQVGATNPHFGNKAVDDCLLYVIKPHEYNQKHLSNIKSELELSGVKFSDSSTFKNGQLEELLISIKYPGVERKLLWVETKDANSLILIRLHTTKKEAYLNLLTL